MKNKIYTISKASSFLIVFICFLFTSLISAKSNAQVYCSNELIYWLEDFGTGVDPSSDANVTSLLTYQATGDLETEGVYRVANSTHQKIEWHNAPDHTIGDVNGKTLVINGEAGLFYRKVINRVAGFFADNYSASLFLMNVNTPGTCAPNPTLPAIGFYIEYMDANNNWVSLINSPVTTGIVPQTANPTWEQLGGVFVLPTTGSFIVTNMRISLISTTPGSCGNDYAIDDIKLANCPSGGPVPVKFLHIGARQKGSGVIIDWSTGSELNNKYFDVEKSIDGGTSWEIVTTIYGSGNSSITKKYSAYDAKPVAGTNLYRIKQVDLDGAFKYSATVNYQLKIVKTDITILENPFADKITIDFLSEHSQTVKVSLIDITGRQLFVQQLSVTKGSSRKVISDLNALKNGMYILQITNENGAILYNGKLIK